MDCINRNIKTDDWYDCITQYIEYTESSFGQLPEGYGAPVGLGHYINNIINYLKEAKIPESKRQRLLAYLKRHQGPVCENETDLSLLIAIYKEWLSIFPFDISFFKPLKNYFSSQVPILKGPYVTNRYTKLTRANILSEAELVEFLANTTKKILQEINTAALLKAGTLADIDKLQIELSITKREQELKEYNILSDASGHYRKLIKIWLDQEKAFLTEITPVFKKVDTKEEYISTIIDGILDLQQQDERAQCIKNLRADGPSKEDGFRNYFMTFFKARYKNAHVSAEELKGNRHIDLMISIPNRGQKILEFKGWWNKDKEVLPEQICGYLTDAHEYGFIFMINDNKHKDITEDYKQRITTAEMGYLLNTWKEHKVSNTQYIYFETLHKFAVTTKTLFHFIFNAYFST